MHELETPRLKLIPFSLELKKAVLHERTRLTDMVKLHISEDWPGPDYEEALPFFIAQLEKDSTVWDGIIVHKHDAAIIGGMGFLGGPDASGAIEMGYNIIPEYRKQGYATEMASALVAWACEQPEIKTVTATCRDDNLASIRVLEKVGMSQLAYEGQMLKWERRKVTT